jgi:predicted GIY-YIG superfamily endonuclease
VNNVDNNVYVGCTTKSIYERFNKHNKNYYDPYKKNNLLYKHMKLVGRKNCKVELLDKDIFETKQDMFKREKHFIKLFGTLNKFHGDKEVIKEIENKINASDVVSSSTDN